ncbi:MAG: ABC transporter permease [Bacteroidales bacterium]|jgi:ABC-type antimicrobial peptide transport system permease subunit
MIKNYFKIALRNIKRYSAHSILNISGMAIGMACTILLLLWVQDEWSYDKHFKNADNIYRVIENPNPSEDEAPFAISSSPLAGILKKDYPEIIRSSRYKTVVLYLKKGDEYSEEKYVAAVDTDFLKMFNIEFIRGDVHTALDAPHNIILTEKMARKYFGNEDALGKTLQFADHIKTVTGVVKSFPHNTHIGFDILVPFEWLKEIGEPVKEWWFRCYNYIELYEGKDSKLVDEKIRDIVKKHNTEWNAEIFLQNIKKIHLFSSRKYTHDVKGQGDIIYVRILAIIAIFILVIACINFMNLYTAQSSRRAKEIGIRKVTGANKRKIVMQFLGESLLIIFVAQLIAIILVELSLPAFNHLTGKQLAIYFKGSGLYIGLIAVLLFCSLLAGSYPALYLSSLNPSEIVKGIINKNPGNTKFRRVLVIFQFSVSILLIICTLTVGNQLNYMQNKDMGINKNSIGYFIFPTYGGDPKLETLKKELSNNPDIIGVTRAQFTPFNIETTLNNLVWSGKQKGDEVLFYNLAADMDYLKTFQLEMVKGHFFSPEYATDSFGIVINEKAAEVMGFENPLEELVRIYNYSIPIIGVMKDFHFKPLHYPIEPLIINIGPSNLVNKGTSNTIFIRMRPDHITSTVSYIEKTYKSFHPPLPLEFHFLDEDFDNLYHTEQRISKIFAYFSLLAIIISCLGLIGLSTFITRRRTKEIGIRKANGAKSVDIFSLLSKEYILLVFVSFVIASPVAWYSMNKWLHSFAYRITMGLWVFALSGTMVLLIMLLTVSLQSLKAARKNPVKALRYE